ncbi:MAG: hypothetical protein HC881_15515, partial [Leptolyngbyaceae cyanobacterium SL_7_1]|nr:hypothetical protein [Leptolyngbyaceae cyanobacterium SL_7_1]
MRLLDRLPVSMHYSVRYLKARLRILKRPAVWGSATLMLLILVGFAEYWNQSESGEDGSQRHSGVASLDELAIPTPSEADSAIGADIDTLPLLLDEFNFGETPLPPPPAPPTTESPDRPISSAPVDPTTPSTLTPQRSFRDPLGCQAVVQWVFQ